MDARKLVGISQRRRKEMFHVEFEAARNNDGTVSMFVADALLSKYRIGQRLRPCKGCAQCMKCSCGNVAACIGLYDPFSKHQPEAPACDECCGHGCEDGYCYKLDTFFPCDGSGVLPAKKAKVRNVG